MQMSVEIFNDYTILKVDSNRYRTGIKRFWAAIIDAIVFSPLFFLHNWFFDLNKSEGLIIFWAIFVTLISTFYSVFLHYKYGQTIGKWAVGIKVVDISETRNISFKQSLFRDGVYILIELAAVIYFVLKSESFSNKFESYTDFSGNAQLVWLLLELITMLTNKKRRALHDYLANSVVIRI